MRVNLGFVVTVGVGGVMVGASVAWGVDAAFVQVAREFQSDVGLLDVNIPAALSADGKVAFVAGYQLADPAAPKRIFTVNGGVVGSIDLPSGGFSIVRSVQVNAAGNIAFVANHHVDLPSPANYRGAYRTTITGGPIQTILERPTSASYPDEGGPQYNIDLSEGNQVAFSTIISGTGAIYRGPLAGSLEVVRTGTGTFYNTKEVVINAAGTVAAQMEHVRPFGGLGRGILVFDAPGTGGADPAVTARTVIEQLSVGVQPAPAINNAGQVAFSLASPITMTFYTPPNNFGGPVLTTQTLRPGVYLGTPNAYGVPKLLTKVVDDVGPFNTFGRVQINDDGVVVFEASLDGGGFGLFTGDDPVLDEVVSIGDMVDGTLVSALYLGELNNNEQFTMMTSDFITTDRRVWVVSMMVPEPGAIGVVVMGVAILLGRRRC
jgi:hypothetical protein